MLSMWPSTQVVTIATYSYYCTLVFGSQSIDGDNTDIDDINTYAPITSVFLVTLTGMHCFDDRNEHGIHLTKNDVFSSSLSWSYTSGGWKWQNLWSIHTVKMMLISNSTGSLIVTWKWAQLCHGDACYFTSEHERKWVHLFIFKVSHVMGEGINADLRQYTWNEMFPWLYNEAFAPNPKLRVFSNMMDKEKHAKVKHCVIANENKSSSIS